MMYPSLRLRCVAAKQSESSAVRCMVSKIQADFNDFCGKQHFFPPPELLASRIEPIQARTEFQLTATQSNVQVLRNRAIHEYIKERLAL